MNVLRVRVMNMMMSLSRRLCRKMKSLLTLMNGRQKQGLHCPNS